MNTNNIKVDQAYKNYKELCNVLGIKVLAGKSKQLQLKDIERHIQYHKEGNKFIIDHIYDIPLPKIDNRKNGNNSIYGELIQFLILDLLVQDKNNGHLSIGRSQLLKSIGIVNNNYTYYSNDINKLAKRTNAPKEVIYDLYNTTNSNFKNAIDTALNKLSDKRIILHETIIKVKIMNEIRVRKATEHEKQTIVYYEKMLLQEYGFNKISDIRNSIYWNLFLSRIKEILNKECNIDYYFFAYDITINEKYILEERKMLLDFLLADLTRKEYKNELNTLIMLNLLKNAAKRHSNYFTAGKKYNFRKEKSYLDDIKKLIEVLINNQSENINKIIDVDQLENKQIDIDYLIDIEELLPF